MNIRHIALIEQVSKQGKVEVAELAKYLNTSQVTVRKDLDLLAEKGILKRERGYAMLKDPDDINYHMAFHYEVKQKIAIAAARLVEDGETIIVESGSTCALFAEEVARSKKDATIITNSTYLAGYIKDYPNVEIILLGGNYQKKSQAMVGPMTKACIKGFSVDKIFVGTDGYSRTAGFTGDDLIRLDTLKEMIAAADKTYVLTESKKFKHPGSVSFLELGEVYEVLTDKDIPIEEKEYMERQGVVVKTL